ncbi:MAG: glycosyltransferase [Anaerolineae bacterium]|nr:glycosyltransferase [Anaerolineae bacterium]
MKKRICIITFSLTSRDPRVLRQIEYLSPHFDLTVLGFGSHKAKQENVEVYTLNRGNKRLWKIIEIFLLLLGKVSGIGYDLWLKWRPQYRHAQHIANNAKADLYHANDWASLVIALRAAAITGAQVVFDAHEYWPLQAENNRFWQLFFSPLIQYTLRKYVSKVDGFITVSPPIAERYREEFGVDPIIVRNAPKLIPLSPHSTADPNHIRLIHHGVALRDRGLESLIEALAQTESRFCFDLMLLPSEPDYLAELKHLAQQLTPDRVTFLEPVAPGAVLETLASYNIALCIIQPTTYNYLMSLPNKLFESLAAGLAVCVGPSPAMAELTRQYDVGWVCDSFEPAAIAKTLNGINVEEIEVCQKSAHEAAKELNADIEMGKLVDLYQRLLTEDHASNTSRNPIS